MRGAAGERGYSLATPPNGSNRRYSVARDRANRAATVSPQGGIRQAVNMAANLQHHAGDAGAGLFVARLISPCRQAASKAIEPLAILSHSRRSCSGPGSNMRTRSDRISLAELGL